MNHDPLKTTLAALCLGFGVFAIGCEEAGDDEANEAAGNIDEAAEDFQEAAEEYGDAAADRIEQAQDALADAAEEMRRQSDEPLNELDGAELAERVRLRLSDLRGYLQGGSFVEARGVLDEVAGVQERLPDQVTEHLVEVRDMLDKAVSAEGNAARVREVGGTLEPIDDAAAEPEAQPQE